MYNYIDLPHQKLFLNSFLSLANKELVPNIPKKYDSGWLHFNKSFRCIFVLCSHMPNTQSDCD